MKAKRQAGVMISGNLASYHSDGYSGGLYGDFLMNELVKGNKLVGIRLSSKSGYQEIVVRLEPKEEGYSTYNNSLGMPIRGFQTDHIRPGAITSVGRKKTKSKLYSVNRTRWRLRDVKDELSIVAGSERRRVFYQNGRVRSVFKVKGIFGQSHPRSKRVLIPNRFSLGQNNERVSKALRHGSEKTYYANGAKRSSAHYVELRNKTGYLSVIDGIKTTYDKDGELVQRNEMFQGKPEGWQVKYITTAGISAILKRRSRKDPVREFNTGLVHQNALTWRDQKKLEVSYKEAKTFNQFLDMVLPLGISPELAGMFFNCKLKEENK